MADDYAGPKGRFYRWYIRRPAVGRVVGRVLWGSDFAPLYRHLANLRQLRAGTTVLDAACGAGVAFDWLDAGRGHRYIGVDQSPSMLHEAREVAALRGFTDVALVVGDIASMPLPDGEAGVVLCYNALHCVPDAPAVLAEVARCLTPGGRLVGSCLVRGRSGRADRLLAADRTMGPGGTAEDLRCWLQDAGFTSIEVGAAGAMATFSATRPAGSG